MAKVGVETEAKKEEKVSLDAELVAVEGDRGDPAGATAVEGDRGDPLSKSNPATSCQITVQIGEVNSRESSHRHYNHKC